MKTPNQARPRPPPPTFLFSPFPSLVTSPTFSSSTVDRDSRHFALHDSSTLGKMEHKETYVAQNPFSSSMMLMSSGSDLCSTQYSVSILFRCCSHSSRGAENWLGRPGPGRPAPLRCVERSIRASPFAAAARTLSCAHSKVNQGEKTRRDSGGLEH